MPITVYILLVTSPALLVISKTPVLFRTRVFDCLFIFISFLPVSVLWSGLLSFYKISVKFMAFLVVIIVIILFWQGKVG